MLYGNAGDGGRCDVINGVKEVFGVDEIDVELLTFVDVFMEDERTFIDVLRSTEDIDMEGMDLDVFIDDEDADTTEEDDAFMNIGGATILIEDVGLLPGFLRSDEAAA